MSKIEFFEINIAQLNRTRKVWVYLPQNYSATGAPQPVIYMHDGQNLFYDELTAYGAAWHVNDTLDKIFAENGRSAIVVGVESLDSHRLSEYSPWIINPLAFKEKRTIAKKPNNGGEGDLYAQFFANDLKHYIDSHYNTDSRREATAVIGSSMGGLISCYLGLKYQQIYETMGLFSTYTPFNQSAFNRFVAKTPQTLSQHALIYCGGKEGLDTTSDAAMLKSSRKLYSTLAKRGISCQLVFDSEMKHYETAWNKHFYQFAYDFLARVYTAK